MASALAEKELNQNDFNLKVWEDVLSDPFYQKIPHRIETNRHGQIIMTPPPRPEHGQEQFKIGFLLKQLLPHGHIITECPLSTNDGIKGIDVAWISPDRHRPQKGQSALTHSPEICVEVTSPSNTTREMDEKKELYFAAGADEFWLCSPAGKMTFYEKENPNTPAVASTLCPDFPSEVTID